MRNIIWALVLPTILGGMGCAGGSSPVAPAVQDPGPAPQAVLGGRVIRNDITESAVGLFTVRVDPVALTATSEPKQARSAQATDDVYELSIENFITPGTLKIGALSFGPTTLDIEYSISHPFAAPTDLAGPPTASNRADLGISGRVLFLVDVASATGNTYFNSQVVDTTLVVDPAGYYEPKGILGLSGYTATLFPFQPLVDELEDPRTSTATGAVISNGGSLTGNYNSTVGWQLGTLGANRDGWTGYGVLHQGQTAKNTLSLDLAALATTPFSFDVAIIAKYADPRGGATGAEKKANRLPNGDVMDFVYREPHGALDVESIEFLGVDGAYVANQFSEVTWRFRVVDWDFRATPTTFADLADDPVPTNVVLEEISLDPYSMLTLDVPGVVESLQMIEAAADDDSLFGGDPEQDSGQPGDALFYVEQRDNNSQGPQTEGTFVGLVRASDPEAGDSQNDWFFRLSPELSPLDDMASISVIYQKVTVDQFNP